MKQFLMKKQKGQGVVEYAGALVVAAVIVAAVLAIGPDGIGELFNTILSTIEANFLSELNAS